MPSHVAVMRLAGGQGPEFGISVNPIPTRGADYAHHITACPPGFEILTASLLSAEQALDLLDECSFPSLL